MPYNNSPGAFEDIRTDFDRALAAPKGIRITYTSRGDAIKARARFNYFRKLDRAANKEVYPSDDPKHGRSAYDVFILRLPAKDGPEPTTLYIEPYTSSPRQIEEIK